MWIWQQAKLLVRDIYRDMESGRGRRDFGFRDQIQRAGIPVMNNISEGIERDTNREFARFLEIAKGSAGEVRKMYSLAADLGYVSSETAQDRKILCRRISAGLSSLVPCLRSHEGPRPSRLSEDSISDLLIPYESSGAFGQ